MDSLNRLILQHIARYRVTVRPVVARMSSPDENAEAALAGLVRRGLVAAHKGLPGNRSVYRLTKQGTAIVEVSEARARPLKSQAIFKHLGILQFCHVEGSGRYRVEDAELRDLIGEPLPEGVHCMGMADDKVAVFNTYVPGPRTTIRSIVRHIREQLTTLRTMPHLRSLLQDRVYGFAVITETTQRRKAILDVLRRPEGSDCPALVQQVRIHVEAVPAFDRFVNGVTSAAEPDVWLPPPAATGPAEEPSRCLVAHAARCRRRKKPAPVRTPTLFDRLPQDNQAQEASDESREC